MLESRNGTLAYFGGSHRHSHHEEDEELHHLAGGSVDEARREIDGSEEDQKQQGKHIIARGLSDALLFGHLAEALRIPSTARLLRNRPHLLSFFESVFRDYFSTKLRQDQDSFTRDTWLVRIVIQFSLLNILFLS